MARDLNGRVDPEGKSVHAEYVSAGVSNRHSPGTATKKLSGGR
jgi:hypothetical protein